jgi:hypothetical protein
MPQDLSRDLEAFLAEHISSVEDLEILAALLDAQTRWWDSRALAAHLSAEDNAVRHVLERFASRNLLDIRISDDVRYQLRPGTASLAQSMEEFATVYKRSPSILFSWVTRRAPRSVRDLADAFRIKRI